MLSRAIARLAVIMVTGVLLSACGGAAHGPSFVPGRSTTSGGATPSSLLINGSIPVSGGPQIFANRRRVSAALRRAKSLTFTSISASATLYPGYAGSVPITHTTSVPPPSGSTYSASVSLSNVPAGNNEWIVMTFTGVASDGSQYALGELSGTVNVSGTSATSSTLTAATTRTTQVLLTMLESGYLSTWDLKNTTTLATTIANAITTSGVQPDAGTGVFDSGGARTIVNAVAPQFLRSIVVSASPEVVGSVTIARDYTSQSELNAMENLEAMLLQVEGIEETTGINGVVAFGPADQFLFSLGGIAGGGDGTNGSCGDFAVFISSHTPPSGTVIPSTVDSCLAPFNGTATTLKGVYGGDIIVGVTTNPYSGTIASPATFRGGTLKLAARAPGSAPVSLTTASTDMPLVVNDPAGYAFGVGTPFQVVPSLGTGQYSNTTFEAPGVPGAGLGQVSVPQPYAASPASAHTISVDTFNPYAIPATELALCGSVLPGCFQLNATQPFAIKRPFNDGGTDVSYFNWKASGDADAVAFDTVDGVGYKVTTTAAGAVTLTSSTATALVPRQVIQIWNTLGSGVRWTLTAKDAASNSYVASAPNGPNNFRGSGEIATVEMDSVITDVVITEIQLTTTSPGAGSFDFGPLLYGAANCSNDAEPLLLSSTRRWRRRYGATPPLHHRDRRIV